MDMRLRCKKKLEGLGLIRQRGMVGRMADVAAQWLSNVLWPIGG